MLSDERRERNKETLGSWLKAARLRRGLTQKDLADAIGVEYYTMISQMELGYISIPPSLWVPLATALKEDIEDFVVTCLSEIQPEVYNALFGNVPLRAVIESVAELKLKYTLRSV